MKSFDLIKYLLGQLTQSNNDRLAALREFYPNAKAKDWRLWQAGQRVQIIKKEPGKGGELHLGSELVHASDGSLTALLGASPGASVSAAIMLELLEHCFSEHMQGAEWQAKIKAMIPSYGQLLQNDLKLNQEVLIKTSKVLGLEHDLMEIRPDSLHSEQIPDTQYAALA